MRRGERCRLRVTAEYGYGDRGAALRFVMGSAEYHEAASAAACTCPPSMATATAVWPCRMGQEVQDCM